MTRCCCALKTIRLLIQEEYLIVFILVINMIDAWWGEVENLGKKKQTRRFAVNVL